MSATEPTGEVRRVTGPVVVVRGLPPTRLHDVVRVGPERLLGEVVRLEQDRAVVQVYEDTAGLSVGDPVVSTGLPLQVELGPGLLGQVFDGIQRPLRAWAAQGDDPWARPFLGRGVELPSLDRRRTWEFTPSVREGDEVAPGDILGTTPETAALEHRVLVPPGRAGRVTRIAAGPLRVEDPAVWIDGEPVSMLRRWPARQARPVARRLDPTVPLITGQRVIDTLFPLARGGTATIPGGFGTGKTVQEQALARWAEAQVVVYVGCGERGNELTEVLEAFGDQDQALAQRTIVVANTSNMPIAAREASVYLGLTLAEYYRDQGYHVALLADSTSRWGEALREVSGRLEEMPGEEGYPADLFARLAGFYERAGETISLGREGRPGSVSIVGAVSPPGGDLSEPISQHSMRLAGTFWALDVDLARRRHYPAIHWTRSYTLYALGDWFRARVAPDWEESRCWALALLEEEDELLGLVQLLGVDALGPTQRAVLITGRRLREDFLQQSAFDPRDAFCPLPKQHAMLRVIRRAHELGLEAIARGVAPEELARRPGFRQVAHMRGWAGEEAPRRAAELVAQLEGDARAVAPPEEDA